jgi:hypothetical protein
MRITGASSVCSMLAALAVVGSARAEDAASVGKISALEGALTRFPGQASSDDLDKATAQGGSALKAGDDVLLGDVLKLASGFAKLTLNDASVIMLGGDTEKDHKTGALLAITEGDFKDQVRSSFSAKLVWGKVWSHVTKALSGTGAKFEVTTPRAVAGVRGTIFRVDAVQFVSATRVKEKTIVRVTEGKVGVDAQVKRSATAAVAKPTGPRHQVDGPQEISKDDWEKKFVELQKGQQIEVGEELWQQSKYDASKKDRFDDYVNKNQ